MARRREALRTGVDIIVATPGRLLDLMKQGTASLISVQYLVLDEADRMLDMGFLPDVRRIVEKCPRDRHTSLFSATIPPEIETLIKWAMHNPETIEIGARRTPGRNVKHVIYPVVGRAEDRSAPRVAGARQLRIGDCLLPHQTRRRPHLRTC